MLLATLLILPLQASAGQSTLIDQTDSGSNRLVAYWDTQGRDSFIQVTNTSSSTVQIHVQVFDVDSIFTPCEECNFDDSLTPGDTHVYDIKNLVTNDMGDPACTDLSGDHGFIVISANPAQSDNSLIGMFRIIDESGYEYRSNASSPEDGSARLLTSGLVNFSTASGIGTGSGNNLSDLVGIAYNLSDMDNFAVSAGPTIKTTFGLPQDEILIWDEDEDDISCSPTYFACGQTENGSSAMNRGVDNALPNSHGDPNRVCASSILNFNSSGWLYLPIEDGGSDYFVGYIGLNNGDGTGSMDSWWAD
jgi:hypothetical protein